ncbi:MAG: hypothetical protein DRP58_09985 [Spirochaetes bacterium]|nr:MAG: hypothetical protein DRP58_09985 [Spirochaetota bacterium]
MRNFIWIIIVTLFFPMLNLSAQDAFGDIFDESEISETATASGTNIEVSGTLSTDHVYFFDASVVKNNEVLAMPEAEVNLKILEGDTEGIISLNISPQKWDPDIIYSDIINELYMRSFFSFGYMEAGLMKVEWGSADGIHVLDPLSFWDLTDGFSLDVTSLKKASEIVKMNIYIKESGLLELAYKPFFSSHIMAQSGRWSTGMENIPNLHIPDTTTLEYSQAALRLTGTIGRFDIGTQYYYGYLPDPALNTDFGTGHTYITYDRAHLFGLEGGFALGFLTFWMEAGYWLTEDMDGSDPAVYNNRLVYLPGMDFTVPGIKLYVNVQLVGDYTFNTENLSLLDVDETTGYGSPSHNNMLLIAGELPFNKDKTKIRLSGMWSIEEEGYMILPELLWDLNDNLNLSIYGQIIEGKDGNAGMMNSWKKNDNFGMKIVYIF